ncbi:MAG: replication restart helicase PriA [Planctomycetota bacterium]
MATLFDHLPEPWEEDEQAQARVAAVVFSRGDLGAAAEKTYDYLVPEPLLEACESGRRVRVPLGRGNRQLEGYCVAVGWRAIGERKLKPIEAVLDQRTLLSAAMLRLTRWIAEYYLCDWGAVIEAVVPAGVRGQAGTRPTTLVSLDLARLKAAGDLKLPDKQKAVLEALKAAGKPLGLKELARVARCTMATINAVRKKGLLKSHVERLRTKDLAVEAPPRQKPPVLNHDQQLALDAILAAMHAAEHRTILVHGVTGSGKTEVYIRAIEEVVRFGRQAIVLVPEISLTPQTVERFRCRFSEVAVLHSHLSDAERHHHWQRIANGDVPVVVGARSAIFAPTPHLGLVVLDEEHEGSFKQDSAPRYHARDVALFRAREEAVPLVLGSATPSLESWHRARQGDYQLVEMSRRVLDRPLPNVGTIDLCANQQNGHAGRGAITRQLHQAVSAALGQGGQVILLLNRRGFSTHIQCPACGHVVRCPECDIALTHHRTGEQAICHYCDYQIAAPAACPECQFTGIRYGGLGTQKLEAEVRARFPNVPCLRMDTDTMRGHGSHERALAAFREGKVRILLGTQMIAKGLDFPNVTLVGVINADTALHLPDFRAAERTFQLVTQVAGRTGRGPKGGRVLVQTFSPDHPAIRAATRHDYAVFAAGELPLREMLQYPPFASMIRLVIRGPEEKPTAAFAAELADTVKRCLRGKNGEPGGGNANETPARRHSLAEARVLGPAPAPFARLRGNYRFQVQAQGPDGEALRAAVRAVSACKPPEHVQWIADVDPLDML